MNNRRVVITGMGVITPIGNTIDEFWQGACSGKNGIGPITVFDASQYDSRIAAEVKNFDPLSICLPKQLNAALDLPSLPLPQLNRQ